MATLKDYTASMLDYLYRARECEEEDIRTNATLTKEQKEEVGLLVRHAKVVKQMGNDYTLQVRVNNSKLRPGDHVNLISGNNKRSRAIIIENGFEQISLTCLSPLNPAEEYEVEVIELVMLASLIKLIEDMDEGKPGAMFLKYLAGMETPSHRGMGAINPLMTALPDKLNPQQRTACEAALQRPSLYCIQGPPGTGKTDVLSQIALAFSGRGKEVLVLSGTHQAVNNALNKIRNSDATTPTCKIGPALKAEGVIETVSCFESYNEYLKHRKNQKRKAFTQGDVIGMTLQNALISFGMRNTGVQPSIILVDEAGQMPLVEGAAIGCFGSGSIIFIGDDRQMPPIFHERLLSNPFSVSIFTALSQRYPELATQLTETYRMNEEITTYVSRKFYEPYGIRLTASEFSKARILPLENRAKDPVIHAMLSSRASLIQHNVSEDKHWEDMNVEEARFIADLVSEAFKAGITSSDMAVITPYRRQVKAIRECCRELVSELPLIDTVERLQGQDVEMIIVSMCVTDIAYFNAQKHFLLNPNRMNVMISRAKKKVIVFASELFNDLDLNNKIQQE